MSKSYILLSGNFWKEKSWVLLFQNNGVIGAVSYGILKTKLWDIFLMINNLIYLNYPNQIHKINEINLHHFLLKI